MASTNPQITVEGCTQEHATLQFLETATPERGPLPISNALFGSIELAAPQTHQLVTPYPRDYSANTQCTSQKPPSKTDTVPSFSGSMCYLPSS
jgi:hypothetical protein